MCVYHCNFTKCPASFSWYHCFDQYIFTVRLCEAYSTTFCLSVCPSVRLSNVCIVTKQKHLVKKVQLWLIGSRPRAFDWYQNRWPWKTLNGVMTECADSRTCGFPKIPLEVRQPYGPQLSHVVVIVNQLCRTDIMLHGKPYVVNTNCAGQVKFTEGSG